LLEGAHGWGEQEPSRALEFVLPLGLGDKGNIHEWRNYLKKKIEGRNWRDGEG